MITACYTLRSKHVAGFYLSSNQQNQGTENKQNASLVNFFSSF